MLAQMTVTDLGQAVAWYTRLFGAEPDARPMEGLAEWHLAETFGVQVWADPDRAGRSAMVLDESDLDQRIRQLDSVGIAHSGAQDATYSRILPLNDPDGNQIVFTGAFNKQ
jgi:catechol-2,3-dioxygenase